MGSGPSERFYDENEAEEILRLAARDGASGRVDKDRLISMAAELGISPEAVERAEAEIVQKKEAERLETIEKAERQEYRRYRRGVLWSSLGSFFGMSLFFVGIWFFSGHDGGFWPVWIIFPWGFGIFPQIVSVFTGGSDRDYQRWRRRRLRRELNEETEPQVRQVLDELARRPDLQHRKIDVIKELRERTGVGLATAKEAVEQYADEHDGVVW